MNNWLSNRFCEGYTIMDRNYGIFFTKILLLIDVKVEECYDKTIK